MPESARPDPALDARALLERCLDDAQSLAGIDADACRQLAERLREGTFNLVVAGEFKRGKSSVINALLGADVLPVSVVPLTSVVTLVRHGESPGATVAFAGGERRPIELREIADYATEKGNPGNAKHVDHVLVSWPCEWLRGGIRIVDTPGIGSVHQHNTDVALRFLPQADAVIFVASADQPVGRAELDFLADIRRDAAKVFCVLNKADYLSDAELRESIDFATRAVGEALQAQVPVIAFSARRVSAGKAQADAELLRAGGLPELDAALSRLLGEERRTVWLRSLARALDRLLARAQLAIGLESKALSEPLERIEASVALFENRKQQTLQSMHDDDVLIDAEARRLQKEGIEPELERFRADLSRRTCDAVGSRFEQSQALPLKRLRAELESFAIDEVRAAYDGWRAEQDARLVREFGRLCERFWAHAQDVADELLAHSAQLFSLPFESARATADWQPQADFHYKFWSEPTGLSQLGSSLVLLLPAFAGGSLVRKRAQEFAADLVETQAGRIRHDFEERLKESARAFRAELRARMEATIAGIESAIAGGMSLRRRGETVAQPRREALARAAGEIERLRAAVAGIAR
jgi:predicted GTPase